LTIIFHQMIVLALDTATPPGSCAIARNGVVLREIAGDPGVSHAARLPRDLMRILDDTGLTLAAVDVFAVASGPGSFTGVRVGIATMQGLAFAADRPLLGVSALEALATIADDAGDAAQGLTATWIDAWRGEVYAALYEGAREVEPPIVASPDVLLRRLGTTRFIGDGIPPNMATIRAVLGDRAGFCPDLTPLLAGAVARIASRRAAAGDLPAADAIEPVYVRRPDAELARDARASC
jgi:tRNA threonylcarbamoyladenosine biosynthesis protein TsaB